MDVMKLHTYEYFIGNIKELVGSQELEQLGSFILADLMRWYANTSMRHIR